MVPQPSHDQSEIGASPHKLCLVIQGPALLEASDSPEIVWKNVCGLVGWGCIHKYVCASEFWGGSLGVHQILSRILSQEKSKAATLSEVQDSVQNLNP